MTYHELVKKVQTALAKADATKVEEHIAVQVNVTGDAEGAFYMEISGGVLYVAAYDYNDRDALLTADGADVLAVAQGKISLQEAISSGKIAHEGDYGKTLMLGDTIPQKKTAAKKAEAAPAVTETAAPAEKPKRGRKPAAKKAEAAPAAAETAAPAEKPKRGRKPAAKKAEAPAAAQTAAPAEKPKRGRKPAAKKAEAPAAAQTAAPAEKPKRGRKPGSKKTTK